MSLCPHDFFPFDNLVFLSKEESRKMSRADDRKIVSISSTKRINMIIKTFVDKIYAKRVIIGICQIYSINTIYI